MIELFMLFFYALIILIFISGLRIITVAKKGCDPERLKKVSGTRNLTAARIGGWIVTILSGLMLWKALA